MAKADATTPGKEIARLVRDPKALAAIAGGAVEEGTKGLLQAALRTIQGAIGRRFFEQLSEELNDLHAKGKIAEDTFESSSNQASLFELLDSVDKDAPDQERMNAMKALFVRAAEQDKSESERALIHQFMRIARKLNGEDILVLKAAFEVANSPEWVKSSDPGKNNFAAIQWLTEIAKSRGHNMPSLVAISETQLSSVRLLGGRTHGDRSGIDFGRNFGLTDLGMKFCEYLRTPPKSP